MLSSLTTNAGATVLVVLRPKQQQQWLRWKYHHVLWHPAECSTKHMCLFSTAKKSSSSSFFSHTSGRKRRRQRLAQQWQQHHKDGTTNNKNTRSKSPLAANKANNDTRTLRDILFPNPYQGQKLPPGVMAWRLPTSFAMFRTSLSMAWKDYKSTWKGFMRSRGILVQDDENENDNHTDNDAARDHQKNGAHASKEDDTVENETTRSSLSNDIAKKRDKMVGNVQRNVQFLAEETATIRQKVRQETGVNNVEDLKRLAGDMMRLAKECLNEFMAGYRKGRDDEVDKMLTKYFKELEDEANSLKKRRRKPKRRVLRRYAL